MGIVKDTLSYVGKLETECDYSPSPPSRYKARYRQLLFNLKDEKNEVLFRKVVHKEIETSQLVLMSHDQLASEELSKWREEELKKVSFLPPSLQSLALLSFSIRVAVFRALGYSLCVNYRVHHIHTHTHTHTHTYTQHTHTHNTQCCSPLNCVEH